MLVIVQSLEHYQQLNGLVGSAAKCGEAFSHQRTCPPPDTGRGRGPLNASYREAMTPQAIGGAGAALQATRSPRNGNGRRSEERKDAPDKPEDNNARNLAVPGLSSLSVPSIYQTHHHLYHRIHFLCVTFSNHQS